LFTCLRHRYLCAYKALFPFDFYGLYRYFI